MVLARIALVRVPVRAAAQSDAIAMQRDRPSAGVLQAPDRAQVRRPLGRDPLAPRAEPDGG